MNDTDKTNALDWLNEIVANPYTWRMYYSDGETKTCAKATLELLKEHEIIGHWEEPEDEGIMLFHPAAYVQCSVCKRKSYFGHNDKFCRHCGAKMEAKKETP